MSGLEMQIEAGEEAIRETTGLLAGMLEKIFARLPSILVALVVFVLGMLLVTLVNRTIFHTMKRAKLTKTAASFGQSLVRILLYTILIMICLSISGVPIASIIAVVGAMGMAIALALQNSLSNVAGGFIILFEKPFQRGDYIITSEREGFVESVSILYTRLTTRDNRSIYVPNSLVAGSPVVNLSQNGKLRLTAHVPVSYDTDLGKVRTVLLDSLTNVSVVLKEPKPYMAVSEFADSSIDVAVYFWVKKGDYFVGIERVLEAFKNAMDENKIVIPFPQLDIHNEVSTRSAGESERKH
ncbi:MAG: mechanosensitive ion channel family protein [Oscillospiraceae bacterium]|nr:mechanosensitive ion channel family protein [Oscillospiraceae bacterium]